jgi:hypothetical protein
MAISVLHATEHLNHAIGGPLVGISNQRVLDEAGQKLYRQADWNFLKRPSTTITTVTDQSWVPLPVDFGSIIRLGYTSGTMWTCEGTSMGEISRMREVSMPATGMLFYAVDYKADTNGKPVARLEIYPTPTTGVTAELTLFYRAGWEPTISSGQGGTLDTSNTYIRGVPFFLEDVYLQFVRAVAKGYQTQNMGQEIAAVISSPDFASALRYDRSVQWEHGPMSGGALESADDGYSPVWYLRNAPQPPAPG